MKIQQIWGRPPHGNAKWLHAYRPQYRRADGYWWQSVCASWGDLLFCFREGSYLITTPRGPGFGGKCPRCLKAISRDRARIRENSRESP